MIGYSNGRSCSARTIPVTGTIKAMSPKTSNKGKPIKIHFKREETDRRHVMETWKTNACKDNFFNSRSFPNAKTISGTRTGANHILAWIKTLIHLSYISSPRKPTFFSPSYTLSDHMEGLNLKNCCFCLQISP